MAVLFSSVMLLSLVYKSTLCNFFSRIKIVVVVVTLGRGFPVQMRSQCFNSAVMANSKLDYYITERKDGWVEGDNKKGKTWLIQMPRDHNSVDGRT